MRRLVACLLGLALLASLPADPAEASVLARASRQIVPGASHTYIKRRTPAGPMVMHVLRADPHLVTIKSVVAQRRNGGFARAPVSQIARASGALAAINGSFFNYVNNEPAGLMVQDGQIISSGMHNRSVFGIRYDGTPFIDDAQVRAAVMLEDGRELAVAGVNRRARPNQMTLYTSHFGAATRTALHPYRYEAAIDARGNVIEASNGNLPIPRGGYVLSANGAAFARAMEALRPGARALVYTQLSGVWEGVRYAIGGGPTIVHNGKVHVTARQEGFGSHIASGRAPRTAIGYTPAGITLMVTVDGRVPKHSVGCTLKELARLMIELGAIEAINLDGGGSTVMVIAGKPVNRISAGVERLVSNAIGIFPME
ncbi:MAG: phosphodiester glycosidase family protein [Candidatus Sericytochromatia bacterium]|nr:phosphodiester glycosidase family protein [Candidatus Sericytochromatia bacterium]